MPLRVVGNLYKKPEGSGYIRSPRELLKEGETYAFTFLAILATVLAKVVI
jgi:hypothetical protein